MTTITEQVRDNEGLVWEMNPEFRAVDVVDVSAVQLDAMTIVGKRTKGAITSAKTDVAGANKGAITLNNTTGAEPGVYKLICVEPYQPDGTIPAVFEVVNAEGEVVGVLTAGVAFDGPTGNITKAVGTADAAGDVGVVTVTQAAGTGKVVRLAAAGSVTDGSDEVYGIVPRKVEKSASARKAAVITEFAVVQDGHLTYPAAAGAAAKAVVNAALRDKHIVVKATQVVG